MANIKLLKRLRTRFLRMRHPKHFKMDTIAEKTDCGTAMCIAGHTLDLLGYKSIPCNCSENCRSRFLDPKGREVDPISEAQDKLGLPSNDLFYSFDLKTPKQAAERISDLIEEYS